MELPGAVAKLGESIFKWCNFVWQDEELWGEMVVMTTQLCE